MPSGMVTSLMNGRISVVSTLVGAVLYRKMAAARPNTDCQKYFQRLGRPREFFSITLR
ncbi:hypothetical protein D3C72_1921620 [compost metagenome]